MISKIIENKWIKRLIIFVFFVIPMIGGIFSLYTTNPNVFTDFPHTKLSTFDWILNNCIYLLPILAFICLCIFIFFILCLIKQNQDGKKIKREDIAVLFLPFFIFFFYMLFIENVLIFLNRTFISNPQYETKNVVIHDFDKVNHRKGPDSYYAQVYLINDTNIFKIEIDSKSYYKYREKDTLELKIFQGALGFTEIDSYRRINFPFVYEKFSINKNNFEMISPSNLHTKIADNYLYWSDDIKQYEVVNIHYKKGKEYEYTNNDLYKWDWYAEKSTWEEKENPWHPFSKAEITYILKERQNAEKLHFLASVEGINGLVILPDKWDITDIHDDKDIPDSLKITPTTGVMKYSANIFTDTQWGAMQCYGAIFLPAAGCAKIETIKYKNTRYKTRKEIKNRYENQKGYYWTSTPLKDETKACCLVFSEDRIGIMQLDKSYHCSIRMIKKY